MNISLFRSRQKILDYLCNRDVFSPDLSMTNSKNSQKKFSKTVHTISIKIFIIILHPKVLAPVCAMESKSYGWDVRNIARINPKWPKPAIFEFFSIFSKPPHTIRTKFFTVILHHIMVLCVQGHQSCMTWIRASQKEKDLSRLFYRTCGSGLLSFSTCFLTTLLENNSYFDF